MSETQSTSESILPRIAKQEQDLLERIRASEEEAQKAVEQAHADARAYQQERSSKLAGEVAGIRQEAEEVRLRAFQSTIDEAEQRLVSVREAALDRVPEMANEVLALFVPKHSGGSKS